MYSCDELLMHSLECYFVVHFPRCCATREINTKITLSWAHKQFATRVHTIFSIYWGVNRPSQTTTKHVMEHTFLRVGAVWGGAHSANLLSLFIKMNWWWSENHTRKLQSPSLPHFHRWRNVTIGVVFEIVLKFWRPIHDIYFNGNSALRNATITKI